MADLKHITPTKILWVDLEMTGLNAQKDRIVEVAAIITDWNFTELGSLERGVKQDVAEITQLFVANPWASARPESTQELIEISQKGIPETEVENEILQLVDAHFAPGEPVLLAGNSIHCDRGFITRWWPNLEKRLHYRMLDVSAWKVVMQGKYGVEYTKKEAHRALGDIRESIEELESYLAAAQFRAQK